MYEWSGAIVVNRRTGWRRCIDFDFFFQAEDGIRDWSVTGVQTCALPISPACRSSRSADPPGRALDRGAVDDLLDRLAGVRLGGAGGREHAEAQQQIRLA